MQKRHFLFLLLAVSFFSRLEAQMRNVSIDSIVALMTIEEKVGQMSQIDLGVIAQGEICNLKNPQVLDTARLRIAIQKYKIGSVLNVGCGSGTISLENWNRILDGLSLANNKYSRLRIPVLYGIDAIHGANYTMGATLFPQQIGQAATWNPEMVKAANAVSAYETRASGLPWNFSPVLDIGRQPLWSRFFETYGEDVVLAKAMTNAAIQGLQGDDVSNPFKVAACMKHFLGYSFPLSGRDRTPAWIPEIALREYFLPTFQTAINAGAKTVMINSGEINGVPVHINYDILTRLLRDELGFKGVAVTDWEDIYKLVNVHHVAATKKDAVKMAIMAGIDMSMTPNDFEFSELLVALVKEGAVPMSRIDQAVTRILTLKKELGLFQVLKYPASTYPKFGSAEHIALSYQAASESVTLLKNENHLLPLQPKGEKLFVCGPAANSLNLLNGAWTHTWQGVDTTYNTKNKLTIVQALQKNFSNALVSYAPGSTLDALYDTTALKLQAASADKIIICVGEKPCTEIPGNIDDLDLPLAQQNLVAALSSLHKPIVLVCCFNRPRIIHSLVSKADAIIYAYLPGDEGGRAIADCISGKINPSGKLPFTYPAASNAIVHYDRKATEDNDIDFSSNGYKPEFDFGFGLSYTSFSYSDLRLSKTELADGDSIEITLKVTNTGTTSGKEVIQLYYKDLVASVTPSMKKLTDFQKVEIASGAVREIRFIVKKENFSFVGRDLKRITEAGEIELQIANLKTTINVK